jgi:O-antigen/teichoic acid export membrane protein
MKNKIIKDVVLNLMSTIIPLVVLQLLILPYVATRIEPSSYGLMLTIISLMTMISTTFGNVLNNTRLLMDLDYKEKKITGDFNLLLIGSSFLNVFIMTVGTLYYYKSFNITSILLILIISFLELVKEYLVVSFRIELNYKKILLNSVITLTGYAIGTIIFIFTGLWQFIYLFGLLLSLIYIILNSNLLTEKYEHTTLFKITSYKALILLISAFLGKAMQYIDKLILFPLIGGTAVSIYYVATLSGKLVAMAISPINSVALSYLSKMKKFEKGTFKRVIISLSVMGVIGYVICIVISKPLLSIIYPQWINDSMKYIYITTLTAVISSMCSLISPIIIKFCNINWQIIINLISFIIYLVFSILLFKIYDLYGFCLGILIANVIKLIIMIGIYFFNDKKMI